MSHKSFIKKCKRGGGVTPSSEQVSSDLGGEISRHTEEQHLQSAECRLKTEAVCKTFQPNEDTFNANVVISNEESQERKAIKISCHTERKRKYPVTNSKELLCKKDSYTEITNQLDCFGSKEPHNDDNSRYSRHSECNEESQSRENITNNAILRGLNNCSPQKDGKNSCRLTRGEVGSKRRKVAFTLAEVLITLGIIGVVAALTLPTLIAKYDEMVMVNKIKRSYSELANAIEMRKAELGVSNYAEQFNPNFTATEQLNGFVKYLNVVERCAGYSKGCGGEYDIFPKQKTNDGFGNIQTSSANFIWTPRVVLNDGTLIAIYKRNWTDNCKVEYETYEKDKDGNYKNLVDGKPVPVKYQSTSCVEIFFDVNGAKGRNQFGYDVFSFNVVPNKIDQHAGYGGIYDVIRTGKLTYEKYSLHSGKY